MALFYYLVDHYINTLPLFNTNHMLMGKSEFEYYCEEFHAEENAIEMMKVIEKGKKSTSGYTLRQLILVNSSLMNI